MRALVFAALVLAAPCASAADEQKTKKADPKSPGVVVVQFLYAIELGEYERAASYVSKKARGMLLDGNGKATDLWQVICEQNSHGGLLDKVEVVKVVVDGNTAKVTSKIYLKKGSAPDDVSKLLLEDGAWKILPE